MNEKGQNLPFLGNPAKWYRYQNKGGTGTTRQNTFGTGTDPSGTGTTTSCNLESSYAYIVKLKFEHRGYRKPNK